MMKNLSIAISLFLYVLVEGVNADPLVFRMKDQASVPNQSSLIKAEFCRFYRENRLQALEKRIEALLKEVRALRAGSKPTSTQGAPVEKAKVPAKRVPLNVQLGPVQQIELRRYEYHLAAELANKGHDVVSLARATYKLPHDKAEILAAFFRDHVKAKVMETKVEGDTLTITTTPETQKALDSVIGLVQGKPTAAKDNTGSAVQELSEAVRRNRLEKYRELMEQVEKQRAPGPAKPKQ